MLEQLANVSDRKIVTDVCIAGAGPAGISLALTLADLGLSCVLLEAGPLDSPTSEQRDPYKGETTGLAYPLGRSRLRRFGGTSAVWGGWCKPLDPIDFTRRPTAPLPSWPIGPADLEPHFAAALAWCEIPDADFETESSVPEPGRELLFDGDPDFTSRVFRFSPPTRFGDVYREAIRQSEKVRCFSEATLLSLEQDNGVIRSATAGSLEGDRAEIEASYFVLAMGGIEVPRFLLHLADSTGARFGDEGGLLGACFMDHFGFHPGYLAAANGLSHHRHAHGEQAIMPVITLSADLQRELDLPSICLMATPDSPSDNLPPGYFQNPGITGATEADILRYRLQLICEPTAHPESRITLGSERDAFGMKRLSLHWNVLDEDYLKVEEFMGRFERAVGRAGLGRVQRTQRFEGKLRRNLSVGWHHMGTTRMAEDSRFGVVDRDCRVFGTANLFVASTSVFPRAGYSNPTLALLALTDRLAQHLSAGSA